MTFSGSADQGMAFAVPFRGPVRSFDDLEKEVRASVLTGELQVLLAWALRHSDEYQAPRAVGRDKI